MTFNFRDDERFLRVQAKFEEAFEVLTSKFQFDGLDQGPAIDHVSRRFEQIIESAYGPVFGDDGYISPIETATESEVVRWFGSSARRQQLLERVRIWISLARSIGAKRLLLNGSFVTAKDEPSDVDAAMLLPEDFSDQLIARRPKALELFDMHLTREPKELFLAEVEEDWWGWFEFFSRTREPDGCRKGLIEVQLR